MDLCVLHLVGSPVDEFHAELSRLYAADCLGALNRSSGLASFIAYVAPDGSWRFPVGLDAESLAAAPRLGLSRAIDHLLGLDVDVVVPQMFCLPGMTSYRALLDVLELPYLGNPPDVMALAADKARTRTLVSGAGVDVPPGEVVCTGERPGIPLPVVVKPVDADNSDGLSLVRDPADLGAAIAAACAHSGRALVETYIPLGREVRCGVLERDGELVGLPLEEYAVDPHSAPIRTAADKLARTGSGKLRLVAKDVTRAWTVPIDDPVTEAVWEAARRAHRALGGRHYGLFDFRIDTAGRPWFLEAGPYCSFAPTSVIATMAAAAGIALPDLFDIVLREAGMRGAEWSR